MLGFQTFATVCGGTTVLKMRSPGTKGCVSETPSYTHTLLRSQKLDHIHIHETRQEEGISKYVTIRYAYVKAHAHIPSGTFLFCFLTIHELSMYTVDS